MDRRSFLRWFSFSPVAVAAAANTSVQTGVRLSVEQDDPGYRAYCLAHGDGKKIKIFLNEVEQKACLTVDESAGMIKRMVFTAKGNVAHDGENFLTEEVYGHVRVEFS
jgi:hypothetical protein